MNLKTTFAFLGVAGTAAFVGNMLTIGLGFGGYWQSLDPTAFMASGSEHSPAWSWRVSSPPPITSPGTSPSRRGR